MLLVVNLFKDTVHDEIMDHGVFVKVTSKVSKSLTTFWAMFHQTQKLNQSVL